MSQYPPPPPPPNCILLTFKTFTSAWSILAFLVFKQSKIFSVIDSEMFDNWDLFVIICSFSSDYFPFHATAK